MVGPSSGRRPVGLSKWLWQQWRQARGAGKLASSFVAEKVVERDAQGGIRRVERVELRGPVDAAAVDAAIDRLMTSG